MSQDAKALLGVIRPLEHSPCFGIAAFGSPSDTYTQVIDSNWRIIGFEPTDMSSAQLVQPPSYGTRSVGEEATIAFFLSDEELIVGSHQQISTKLKSELANVSDRPFLSLDVAGFVGDEQMVKTAALAARAKARTWGSGYAISFLPSNSGGKNVYPAAIIHAVPVQVAGDSEASALMTATDDSELDAAIARVVRDYGEPGARAVVAIALRNLESKGCQILAARTEQKGSRIVLIRFADRELLSENGLLYGLQRRRQGSDYWSNKEWPDDTTFLQQQIAEMLR